MANNSDGEFIECLIHLTKPNGKIRLQFEFENPERWTRKFTGMIMSAFANLLDQNNFFMENKLLTIQLLSFNRTLERDKVMNL